MNADNYALSEHATGGLLLGGYPCPDSVPNGITDPDLAAIVEAIIAVHFVDGVWPVDLGRVVDVLRIVGTYDRIGGAARLNELMTAWSDRIERAERLGLILAWAWLTLDLLHDELATEERLARHITDMDQARERSASALAALHQATGRAA